ncbi:MAG: DUF6435 family protein [Acidobacteriota bacterium]
MGRVLPRDEVAVGSFRARFANQVTGRHLSAGPSTEETTMFGWGDPAKKLEKRYVKLMEEARDLQRRGDMPAYAAKVAEAEEVGRRLDEARSG